jgi:hypothetical protein
MDVKASQEYENRRYQQSVYSDRGLEPAVQSQTWPPPLHPRADKPCAQCEAPQKSGQHGTGIVSMNPAPTYSKRRHTQQLRSLVRILKAATRLANFLIDRWGHALDGAALRLRNNRGVDLQGRPHLSVLASPATLGAASPRPDPAGCSRHATFALVGRRAPIPWSRWGTNDSLSAEPSVCARVVHLKNFPRS